MTAASSSSVTMSRSSTVGHQRAPTGAAGGAPRRGRPATGRRAPGRRRTNSRRSASTSRSVAGRQAQLGDGLDVEALIGLEQLERIQAQAGPVVGRSGAALAHDAAERRHPAEALVGLQDAVALDAAIDLGARARARRAGASRTSARPGRAPSRHRAARRRGAGARTAARRRGAPPGCGRPARPGTRPSRRSPGRRAGCSQACPTLTWVTTSKVRPRASATVSSANGSRLPPSREVGRRMPLAMALSLPIAGRDEGQHAVGLAQVEARQDDGLGGVATGDGHDRPTVARPVMHPDAAVARIPEQTPVRIASPAPASIIAGRRPRWRRPSNRLPAANMFRVHSARDDRCPARSRPRRAHRRHRGRDRPPRPGPRPVDARAVRDGPLPPRPSTAPARAAASGCARSSASSPTPRSPATTSARCPGPRPSSWATTSASSTTTSRTATASAATGRPCGRSTASRRPSTPATRCSACRASPSIA